MADTPKKREPFSPELFMECFMTPLASVMGLSFCIKLDPGGSEEDNPAFAASLAHALMLVLGSQGYDAGEIAKLYTKMAEVAEEVNNKSRDKIRRSRAGEDVPLFDNAPAAKPDPAVTTVSPEEFMAMTELPAGTKVH